MENSIHLHYEVDGEDFTRAGEASSDVKHKLKKLNVPSDAIRRIAIAMYEGEINMVAHADGGVIDVDIYPDKLTMVLNDVGPGISDIELAIQEGYSTASPEVRSLGFGAGMGLPNMKRSSDEMNIETEIGVGTKITMTINY
ncbi:MAG: ATP-binding protein [Eubacteriaceae bacterium]|nr:ATP-binding protein [Eubacteriaceae bacterium]